MKGVPGEIIAGRYRIERPIGSGGFGTVYIGRQMNLDRAVAVKVMRQGPENPVVSRERFRREAVWTSTLNHPNVVTYHDFLIDDDNDMLLVMEYLQGATLDEVIAQHGKVECARTARIIIEAARGLAEAHRAGLVHRDVKPSNIFLMWPGRPRERAKVIDFGILWADPEVKGEHRELTRANAFIGTPEYVAPEVLVGAPVNGRTDQYALALVAMRALTGVKPWPSSSGQGLLARLGARPPVLGAPEVAGNPALAGVLYKASSPDPGDRFPDMDAFADALGDAMAARPFVGDVPRDLGVLDGTTVLELRDSGVRRASNGKSAVDQPVDDQRADEKPAVAQPVHAQPGDDKPAVDQQPVDSEPVRARPGWTRFMWLGVAAILLIGVGIAVGGVVQAMRAPTAAGDSVGRGAPTIAAAPTPEPVAARAIAAEPTPEPVAVVEPATARETSSPASAELAAGPARSAVPPPAAPTPARSTPEPAKSRPAKSAPQQTPAPAKPVPSRSLNAAAPQPAAQPAPQSAAQPTAPASQPAARGHLRLNSSPWALVTVDGRPYGQTLVEARDLEPGPHVVVFTNPSYPPVTRRVVVKPGETVLELVNFD